MEAEKKKKKKRKKKKRDEEEDQIVEDNFKVSSVTNLQYFVSLVVFFYSCTFKG